MSFVSVRGREIAGYRNRQRAREGGIADNGVTKARKRLSRLHAVARLAQLLQDPDQPD